MSDEDIKIKWRDAGWEYQIYQPHRDRFSVEKVPENMRQVYDEDVIIEWARKWWPNAARIIVVDDYVS